MVAGFPGSIRQFRGPLLQEWLSRGDRLIVAAPGLLTDTETSDWLRSLGIDVHDVPFKRAGTDIVSDLRALLVLYRLIKASRPDLVFCYTIKPVVWGMIASHAAKVPKRVAMITGLGYVFTGSGGSGLLRGLVMRLYRAALRRASLIIFQNPDDRKDFATLAITLPAIPTVIVNGSGVDVDEYRPAPFPDGALRFILIARLLADKGIREYVAAAEALRSRWPDAAFHIVGGRDDNPAAIPPDEVAGWADKGILWQGEVADVRPSIAAAHVLVHPSYREGTPRVVLEAMSMGRPVITTDAPGCRETVVEGTNGYLVPVRDAKALAGAMEIFLGDPSLVPFMGERARGVAEEKYHVRKVNASINEAIDNID